MAIARYLCENNNAALLGATPMEKSQVVEWCEYARNEIRSKAKSIIYPIFGFAPPSEAADSDMKALKEHVVLLNKHLETREFVVGNQLTLADLTLAFELCMFFRYCFVEGIRKSFPKVTSWIQNILSSEHAIKSLGRTILCKVPLKAPKVEKKKEEAKAKEAEKPVVAEPQKKKVNPLDELPPSNFVLDDWKKEFMNSKDREATMKSFWEKYDPAGYSLWHFHYQKLPSEGKILFKTSNSSSFFLQKLDSFRKYSFATHGVYGVEENYDIRGLWMWRGTEVAEAMAEQDNFPYMTVRKLDSKNEADRKLVENYWLDTEEGKMVDGMPVADVTLYR